MKVLIDGDIICYRVGFTTNESPEGIAIYRAKESLENILVDTGASDYQVWLSDSTENNFRTQLYPEYKANRTQPKPKHHNAIREYMVRQWDAQIAHNMEADDALGINQQKDGKTIIASIDKDLRQIPGLHYNFVKKEFDEITEIEGIRNFYTQVLQGDSIDNIKGCPKIGPVKARQALLGIPTEFEMYKKVVKLYLDQHAIHKPEMAEDDVISYLVMTCQILKIKQSEDEQLWQPPVERTDSV